MSATAPAGLGEGSAGVQDPGKLYRARTGIPVLAPLDGLRAVAIAGVVLVHTFRYLFPPTSELGIASVYGTLTSCLDILFVLSGFVLFLPTAWRDGKFGPAAPYLLRRAARVYPALWLVLALCIVLIAIWPTTGGPPSPALNDIGYHVIGIHLPMQLIDIHSAIGLGLDGPMWTLSVELLFYLLLPFVAGYFYRHPVAWTVGAAIVAVAWRVGADHFDKVADFLGLHSSPQDIALMRVSALGQFPCWVFHFAAGMSAALIVSRLIARGPDPARARRAGWVQLGALVAFIAITLLAGRYAIGGNPLSFVDARGNPLLTLAIPATIATFMGAVSLAPRLLQLPLSISPLRWFADISYGVYLIHVPAILFLSALIAGAGDTLLKPFGTRIEIGLAAAVAIVAWAWASSRLYEIPIRRWAREVSMRWARRPKRVAGEPS